jgi:hypothetical protein
MGELRTKERRKSGRAYIGHHDGKQNKTVIISLPIPHVSVLLLNGFGRRPTQPNDLFGLKQSRIQAFRNFEKEHYREFSLQSNVLFE